ncbi:MAG: hypothetical protein L3J33_02260 [Rhodobacteraceae bacterium]|nr:hypothetical protein [Paracoccaceae bacterium]
MPLISGLQPLDTYVSRASVSPNADYAFAWFTADGQLELVQNYLQTSDPAAADICARLEASIPNSGENSQELIAEFQTALENGAYWWAVRPADNFQRDFGVTIDTVFVNANFVGFVDASAAQQIADLNQIHPDVGGLTISTRWPSARIVALSGLDTALAEVTALPIAKNVWATCHVGFNLSGLFHAFQEHGDSISFVAARNLQAELGAALSSGVWNGCRTDYGPNGEYGDYLAPITTAANCPALEIDGYSIDANMLGSVGSTAAGGIPERFIALCPETSARLLGSPCQGTDITLFSCKIEGRAQHASICQSSGTLTYSFGIPNQKPELVFSNDLGTIAFDFESPASFIQMTNGAYTYEAWKDSDGYEGLNLYQNGEFLQSHLCE